MSNSKTSRTRNYATVVYPESAPVDWIDVLSSLCIPSFISPLHNRDLNPSGEVKKPHFHVLIMFDSVKTSDQAQAVFSMIGGVGTEIVQSVRGYARYLCHLDNPEKAQYDQADIKSLSGADYVSVISLAIDRYKAIGEMIDFCVENNIVSYSSLLEYSRLQRFDWFRVLCDSGTIVMREYLKSRAWTESQG